MRVTIETVEIHDVGHRASGGVHMLVHTHLTDDKDRCLQLIIYPDENPAVDEAWTRLEDTVGAAIELMMLNAIGAPPSVPDEVPPEEPEKGACRICDKLVIHDETGKKIGWSFFCFEHDPNPTDRG